MSYMSYRLGWLGLGLAAGGMLLEVYRSNAALAAAAASALLAALLACLGLKGR